MCNIPIEAALTDGVSAKIACNHWYYQTVPAFEQRQVWAVMLQPFSVPMQHLKYSREQKGKLAL